MLLFAQKEDGTGAGAGPLLQYPESHLLGSHSRLRQCRIAEDQEASVSQIGELKLERGV